MKRIILIAFLFLSAVTLRGQIIADHTIVDDYDIIPQQYIDSVKKMFFNIAGESHAYAYRIGLELLEAYDATYQVNYSTTAPPETATSSYLRTNRVMYGDLDYASSWRYSYGEEDWYTSSTAIARTKAGITYCNNNGYKMDVLGFGFCWDPAITDMTAYLSATQEYIDYCATNGYTNKIIFTTGPVDLGYSLAEGYNAYLNWTAIRNYVNTDENYILLDYADILCYDDGSETPNTRTYNGQVYPCITTTNGSPEETGHISNAGALRLGKAVWWLMARIAGWDGEAETIHVADHYCAPDGNDVTGDGTYGNPWQTLTKAVSEATAGDTVYFRGGVYSFDNYTYINNRDGTSANPICFFNYPDEVPIFDYTNYTAVGDNSAIYMVGSDYVYFRGITVRNVNQAYDQNFLAGIRTLTCLNLKFTNMTVHHIQGKGFRLYNSSAEFVNCDAYRCFDPLRSDSFPGNGGSGFNVGSDNSTFLTYSFYGCRSWENSDQGFSGSGYGTAIYDNCWSWNNAPADMALTGPGLGSGFKFGLLYTQGATLTVKNCISAYNPHGGFNNNAATSAPTNQYWYNNTAYECNTGFSIIQTIAGTWEPIELIARNNICYSFDESYSGDHYNYLTDADLVDDHNSWSGGITLSPDQFASLDTAQLSGSRKPDGSLPDITFLTLSTTSDMIDAGVDVGIAYNGVAPDLGAFEFDSFIVNNPYDGVDFSEYYKSNFHTHTTESDGSATPIIQINALADAGYDIVAITDHDYYGTAGTTWPWTTWITEDPSVVYSNGAMEIAAFYPDLGTDGVFAIRGSELSWFDHVASIFSDVDYSTTPGSLANSLAAVAAKDGYAIFAHPLDYDRTAEWYNSYFDTYLGTAIGIDLFTSRMTDSTSAYFDNTSEMWDAINATRGPDSLIWGFSNLDRHSNLTGFWNYNYHFIDTLTDVAIKENLISGAFTFSFQPAADLTGTTLTPRLTGVTVSGNVITLTASDCNGYQWYDNTSTLIGTDNSIDISNTNTNFVRAVLYNSYGRTYTQPFGIDFFDGIDSTATDILTFTLPTQTGVATLNATNHTVAIEVSHLATITNLTPSISVSYGATISPASMTSRDFTTPQTYTVTALDGTTTQEWVVTVTQDAAPPVDSTGRIVKFGGKIMKR